MICGRLPLPPCCLLAPLSPAPGSPAPHEGGLLYEKVGVCSEVLSPRPRHRACREAHQAHRCTLPFPACVQTLSGGRRHRLRIKRRSCQGLCLQRLPACQEAPSPPCPCRYCQRAPACLPSQRETQRQFRFQEGQPLSPTGQHL